MSRFDYPEPVEQRHMGAMDAVKGISLDRLRELAEAERKGRILILWKPIEEKDGMFTVLYRRPDGVLMGRTDHTAEKAVKNATADYDAHYPRKEKPMKSEKLMPCPFCGSDDCEFTETKQQIDYEFRASYFAGCPDCGVYTDYCETKEEATERWNRRNADDHK